ncbi:MAG TPA: vitamin K epoxide reductase family protein [Acidimicrobiales bacterium]|jgi:uncharacterized membrane protein
MPRWTGPTALGLTVLAVGLTGYLTVTHYTDPAALACPDSGVVNCTLVTTSSWSVILGVPVAVLGLGWALVVLAMDLPWVWRSPPEWLATARLAATGAGAAMVLYLVYVELFRIGAICLWCTGVHITAVLLFAVTLAARSLARQPSAPGSAPVGIRTGSGR